MNEKQKALDNRFNQIRAEHDAHHVRYSESTLFDLRDYALSLLADEPEKSLRDYTLAELAALVHDMAQEKGWWDSPREWPEIACLIHSEISEAVECYRNGEMAMHIVDGKPEGLVVELADVVIRCLDYLASKPGELDGIGYKRTVGDSVQNCAFMQPESMLEGLFDMHQSLSRTDGPKADRIWYCLGDLFSVAKKFDLDLASAVVAKIEYNATRPYRHGGKKA